MFHNPKNKTGKTAGITYGRTSLNLELVIRKCIRVMLRSIGSVPRNTNPGLDPDIASIIRRTRM